MRLRTCALSIFFLCSAIGLTPPASVSQGATPAPTVSLEGLGKGTAALDVRWQFHVGDDLSWAEPQIKDASGQGGWEAILPDRPWGAQGHYAYAGFAWYRLHLQIVPAPGVNSRFQLLLPQVGDAYEVYWNGKPVGHYGSFPPHPSWPAQAVPAVFTLDGKPDGVLAIRVWKGPLGSSSSGYIGGLQATPIVGGSRIYWRPRCHMGLRLPARHNVQ